MNRLSALALSALALSLAAPVVARNPPSPPPRMPALDLNQRLLLRCAATFALVANRQQAGEEWALAFPALSGHGREFFMRAGAQVMDETGIDTATLDRLLSAEARQLVAYDQVAEMMPVCLPLLEQSGL